MRIVTFLFAIIFGTAVGHADYRAEDILQDILAHIAAVANHRESCDLRIYVGRGRAFPFVLQDDELDRGVVRLSGTISSLEGKQRVIAVTKATAGVQRVEDEIAVESTLPMRIVQVPETLSDEFVHRSIKEGLGRNSIQIEGISWTVKGGIVTFEGDCPGHRAVDEILSLALMVPGVRGITSNMTVARKPYPREQYR
jgi:hypothetical protein